MCKSFNDNFVKSSNRTTSYIEAEQKSRKQDVISQLTFSRNETPTTS